MKAELKQNTKIGDKKVSISNVLVVRQPDRTPQDIGKWRNAMKSAERGRRATLYDLYDDLFDVDTVLGNVVEKRISAITNADLVFQVDGENSDEMYDFIDTPDFEDLLTEIMLTKFYGKSVIEINHVPEFGVFSVPRKHIDVENKKILFDLASDEGEIYEGNPFFLEAGKDDDLGIFLRTAPYAIFKRNGGSDYAQFCELFGIPMLAGLYDPDDETGRTEMEDAFQRRGSGGSIVMSKHGDIKTIGSDVSGNNRIHRDFLDMCDEQMTIGVLGQTMTTKDGSSYSQGKIHLEVEESINQSDQRFVQRILNHKLLPILEKRGYPVKNGFFNFAEKGETIPKKELLEMALKVDAKTDSGIDEDWWFEEFGFPKGKRKTEKKDDNDPELLDDESDDEPEVKSKKVDAKKMTLIKRVTDFFGQAPR